MPESRRLYCSDAHRDEFYRWVRSQSRDETIGGWVETRLQVMEEMEQEEAEGRENALRERLDCLAIILEQLKGEIAAAAIVSPRRPRRGTVRRAGARSTWCPERNPQDGALARLACCAGRDLGAGRFLLFDWLAK